MLFQPKWSKAKKQLKSFICEPLRSRVDFQVINYRRAHDQLGRAVITVDKLEKVNMCTITAEREEYYRENEIRRDLNNFDFDNVEFNRDIQDQAHQQLKKEGVYAQYDFFTALENYFNSSIEESLKSPDSLTKILCLLDRRVGKRTLRNIRESILGDHEIVQYFYKLRCEVEKISIAKEHVN
ncbi:SF0329 family protein [Ureibacillus chungkukjangi]|uniref:Uncharacterized protein n=1 Tax=Ureibacillus chungkukjangi TaxID=1202712 RepID=A0A318TVM9_9BACL|nr:hypothetical protein [Ureibacillus chungkukjangi]PYF08423.1 hypothetical protein BJ095_102189 [Ureibacillus chungkukjangi]